MKESPQAAKIVIRGKSKEVVEETTAQPAKQGKKILLGKLASEAKEQVVLVRSGKVSQEEQEDALRYAEELGQTNPLDEPVRISEELGLYDFENQNHSAGSSRQSAAPARVIVTEDGVFVHGPISHIEISSKPEDRLLNYLDAMVSSPVVWSLVTYPARLPIIRNKLALELHCLLFQSDTIAESLAFWATLEDGSCVLVNIEYVPPEAQNP